MPFFSFSFDFHLRINLDIASVVPLILEPIDLSMKWISTSRVSCLFILLIMLCFMTFIYVLDACQICVFAFGSYLLVCALICLRLGRSSVGFQKKTLEGGCYGKKKNVWRETIGR